jgi:flavin reductase
VNTHRASFLEGMSRAAASVSVVTTDGAAGRDGVTVSSMTSVSADPPTMLVCIHNETAAAGAIRENGVFCINLLRDDQAVLSNVFAGFADAPGGDKFTAGEWVLAEGAAPRLADALVTFQCRVTDCYRSGSHFVIIGEVVETAVDEGTPLIYGARSYGTPRYHGG